MSIERIRARVHDQSKESINWHRLSDEVLRRTARPYLDWTADELAAELARLQRLREEKVTRWTKIVGITQSFGFGFLMLAILAIVAQVIFDNPIGRVEDFFGIEFLLTKDAVAGITLVAGVIYIIALNMFCSSLDEAKESHENELFCLTPLSATNACVQTLKELKKSKELGIAWRDYAIERRGQLYGVDSAVLAVCQVMAREDAEVREREKACKELHDLTPL